MQRCGNTQRIITFHPGLSAASETTYMMGQEALISKSLP